jgi:hypothetical protein
MRKGEPTMGYKMYAYAHARDVKVITVTSIADWHHEIADKTPVGDGVITRLATSFKNAPKPAPFNFTWKPDKNIPATLFTSLKYGEEFTLELSIAGTDGDNNTRVVLHFNFYQCKFMKARIQRGRVKVEATYLLFEKSPA